MRAPRPGDRAAIEIVVDDDQDEQPVEIDRWGSLARDILRAEGIVGPAELALRFVSVDEITELNETLLGHEGATDVLSFPIEDDPRAPGVVGGAPILLGDVVICPQVAYRNAPDHAGTFRDELALLVVHGILHLLGMDHEVDEEAEVMEARERELLAEFFVVTTEKP
jgi:probable rRNA maturation factor